jgi:cytochrome c oxidase subunit 3
MGVLLVSLSMLFMSSLTALLITRAQNDEWLAPGMPALPSLLWLSTALLGVISLALEAALRATRRNRQLAATRALGFAWIGALCFLTSQSSCWWSMHAAVANYSTLYPFLYFFLTGLHAAHVLAGFVPLGLVTLRTQRAEYSSSNHEGLVLCVQYWHFLGVIWLVLFAALMLTS